MWETRTTKLITILVLLFMKRVDKTCFRVFRTADS